MISIAIAVYLACASHSPCGGWWEGDEMALTPQMRNEYEGNFATCTIRPEFRYDADDVVNRITKSRSRYESVATKTHVPWQVVAIIHHMECSGNFNCHLHNGDSLHRRTVNVPAGRPVNGKPPFTWERSAIDALTFDGFTSWSDWSVAGTLYKLESYNGMGYRKRGTSSPYLWSGSQYYTSGKYVADGHYDPRAVSGQLGAAVTLRRMKDLGLIAYEPQLAPAAVPVEAQPKAATPLAATPVHSN